MPQDTSIHPTSTMATPSSTKIIQVSQVSPFRDSPDSGAGAKFSLPLTFFDTFWFKFPPVERLFFYSFHETTKPSSSFFFDSVLPKLKHSLSLTLQYFLPLAGKITWPSDSTKPHILYTPGDGVSVSVAESDADFDFLAGNHGREAAASRPLIPQLLISDTGASVISLQITFFPNSGAAGFCIGVVTHHAVLDGKSSTLFMKSWAYLCRENPPLPPELTPFFDRTAINDPSGLDVLYLNQWLEFTKAGNTTADQTASNPRNDPNLFKLLPEPAVPSDLVLRFFEFTRADVEKLRRRVSSSLDDLSTKKPIKSHLSSFVLTFAHVLECILKATDQVDEWNKREIIFGFTADYRNRVEPPVPENYFGNCVGILVSNEEAREYCLRRRQLDGQDELTAIAAKLSDMIKEMEEDPMRDAEEKLMTMTSIASGQAYGVGVAGSPRFGVYGTDFGWGRPKKVELASIVKTGAISMAECRDGSGGIEVGLALKKNQLDVFASLFLNNLRTL